MAEEQPKKRVTKSTQVSADPKTAPVRRATAPDAAAVPKTHAARARNRLGTPRRSKCRVVLGVRSPPQSLPRTASA